MSAEKKGKNRFDQALENFPPRAKAASFNVSDVVEKLTTASPGKN